MNYPFSGYVTCNGAYVEYHGEPVYKAIIPSEAIKQQWRYQNNTILTIILKVVIISMSVIKMMNVISGLQKLGHETGDSY